MPVTGEDAGADTDTGADAGTNADADADTDAGTDADTDADTDTDTGLPNNDAIVAVRVDESGAVNYERSSSGEPGVVSDHWAPQIDTGLVAPPGTGAFDHFLRLLLGPTRGEAGPRAVEQGAN